MLTKKSRGWIISVLQALPPVLIHQWCSLLTLFFIQTIKHQQYAFNFHMKDLQSAATCISQGHSMY